MKVFQVIYFAKGFQRVSIVVTKNEEQAEKMISKDFDMKDHKKLNIIKECEYGNNRNCLKKIKRIN
jgi:hypothetical protein